MAPTLRVDIRSLYAIPHHHRRSHTTDPNDPATHPRTQRNTNLETTRYARSHTSTESDTPCRNLSTIETPLARPETDSALAMHPTARPSILCMVARPSARYLLFHHAQLRRTSTLLHHARTANRLSSVVTTFPVAVRSLLRHDATAPPMPHSSFIVVVHHYNLPSSTPCYSCLLYTSDAADD